MAFQWRARFDQKAAEVLLMFLRRLPFVLIVLASSVSHSQSVGAYRLGMSGKEAAQVGTESCAIVGDEVHCKATASFIYSPFSSELRFSRNSARLQRIRFYFAFPLERSPGVDGVVKALELTPCQREVSNAVHNGCHYPNAVLELKSKTRTASFKTSELISVELWYQPGAEAQWKARQAEARRMSNELRGYESRRP